MKKTFVLLCVLVLIAFSYGVVPAAAPDKDVVVTNTSSNPVPVTVGDVVSVVNIDERARVPYYYNLSPTCPPNNTGRCYAIFPAVPDGKRLRLTNVRANFIMANADAVLYVKSIPYEMLLAFPMKPFNGVVTDVLSLNQNVDLIFEAGASPYLDLLVAPPGVLVVDTVNRLGVTGYLVDIP